MLFGYQPFGVVKLDGFSFKLIHHKPGSSGTADPVNELGSIGWNIWFTPKYFGNVTDVSDPDRAEAYGRNARRLAEEKYAWHRLTARLEAFYREFV